VVGAMARICSRVISARRVRGWVIRPDLLVSFRGSVSDRGISAGAEYTSAGGRRHGRDSSLRSE
jgi:hypothetical protein